MHKRRKVRPSKGLITDKRHAYKTAPRMILSRMCVLLILLVLLLGACSTNPQDEIVGEWRSRDGSTTIEFFEDGSAHLQGREIEFNLEYVVLDDNHVRVQSAVAEEEWLLISTDEVLNLESAGGQTFIKKVLIDWRFIRRIFPDMLDGLIVTVQATFLGFALALVFGLIFALGRRSESRWLSIPSAIIVEFTRSTPLLVQLFFFFFVLPRYGLRLPAFQLGIFAIGLHYGTYCSEVYRAGIDGVDHGQWEAATALNFFTRRKWLGIILPQALPPMIPAFGNYLVAMFKETAQLSAITVVELLLTARGIGTRDFRFLEPITMAGLMYFAVSYPSSLLVQRLEKRFGSNN